MSALLDGVHLFNQAQHVTLNQCTINVSLAVVIGPIGPDIPLDTIHQPAAHCPSSSTGPPQQSNQMFGAPLNEATQAFQAASQLFTRFLSSPTAKAADAILRTAIDCYAMAYRHSHKHHKYHLDITLNYGAALDHYIRRTAGYAGPTTIDLLLRLKEDFSQEEKKSELYLMLLNNLGHSYLNRFRDSRNPQEEDLDYADHYFEQVRSCEPHPSEAQHWRSLLGSAWGTLTRYSELPPPNLAVLENAIKQVQQVVDQHPSGLKFERECYHVLGHIHDALHRHSPKAIGVEPLNLFHLNQALIWTGKSLSVAQDLSEEAYIRCRLARLQIHRHISLERGPRSQHWVEDDLRKAEENVKRVEGFILKEPQLLAYLTRPCHELKRDINKYAAS